MNKNKRWTVVAALRSWDNLNEALRTCTENFAEQCLKHEQGALARPSFLLRIHKRKNALRLKREREAL